MSQSAKRPNPPNLPNLPNLSNLGLFSRLTDEITEIIENNEERIHPRESCQWIKHFCSINKAFKILCDDPNNEFWKRRCSRRGWMNLVAGQTWKELYMYRCQRVHTNETLRESVNALETGDDSYAEITNKYGTIDEWDVAYVTDMSNLFNEFTSRYPLTNYDLSRWDTGRVTTMEKMFKRAKIRVTVAAPFFTWNTSNVTTFAAMFQNFGDVTASYDHSSRFNGGFTGWNTSSATDMSEMFSHCYLNPDISSWDVSSVTTARKMFYYNSVFNRYLGLWNVDSLSDMNAMFCEASAFQGDGLDEWYNPPKKTMKSVEDMTVMFAHATALSVNLASWTPVVKKWLLKNKTYFSNGEFDKYAHPRSLFLETGTDPLYPAFDQTWFDALIRDVHPDMAEEDNPLNP